MCCIKLQFLPIILCGLDYNAHSPFKKMLMTHLHRIRNEQDAIEFESLDLDQHIFLFDVQGLP